MMKKVFDIYADPGHAWCKVPFASLLQIGMQCGQFSNYSYVKNTAIYLEEDCDLELFIKAYTARNGYAPEFREHHCDKQSRIRGYSSNRATDLYVNPSKTLAETTASDPDNLLSTLERLEGLVKGFHPDKQIRAWAAEENAVTRISALRIIRDLIIQAKRDADL